MAKCIGFLIFMAAACVCISRGQNQPQQAQAKDVTSKPSAKEMFLNPRQMAYGAQEEAPSPAKSKPAPGAARPKPKPAPADASDQPQSRKPSAIPVTYSGIPLGLRYTILKKNSDNTTDVSADTEFRSGDHIKLGVEVNDAGYLYIIQQGSSGTWSALFPSPEIENGDNRVQRGHVYNVPPGHVFTFSGVPGTERLFVVFSRQPVDEIDGLIYSLKGKRQVPAAEHSREKPPPETLVADAKPIDDSQVKAIRDVYSRDLIIEKGDEEQGNKQTDKSVYVVNPKGSADSRVVADIQLIHK
jgi:hypothetical protein